jgi:hypothetical protein
MSALGHSRPGPAGGRSSHVRYAPKATVGHQNAIGRDGPIATFCDAVRQWAFSSSDHGEVAHSFCVGSVDCLGVGPRMER